jgi:serine/threonine-protein kinase
MNQSLPGLDGKYQILGKIREGGMGAIYKVRHKLLDEVRVIKVMRPQLESDANFVERFQREAQAASRLRHPNIAQIFDFSIGTDGSAYIVMEFIDGVDLGELHRRQELPAVGLVLDIAHQALTALGFLHQKQFVHRDISPDNLMVTVGPEEDLLVKLIDLGIAKSLDSAHGVTLKGEFLGKFRYASPEHFGGVTGDMTVEPRSDLYSFGIVLYQLLTGQVPFVGKDFSSLTASHLYRPPLDFEQTDPGRRLSPELRSLILRSLEKSPEDRFDSAERMREALLIERARQEPRPERLALEQTLALVRGHADPEAPVPSGSTQERLNRQFPDESTRSRSLPTAPLASQETQLLSESGAPPAYSEIETAATRATPAAPSTTTGKMGGAGKIAGIVAAILLAAFLGWRLGHPNPARPDLSSPAEGAGIEGAPTEELPDPQTSQATGDEDASAPPVDRLLADMRVARDDLLTLETSSSRASDMAEGWSRFSTAFADDLPGTEEDDRIRALARQRQGYWEGRSAAEREMTARSNPVPRPQSAPAQTTREPTPIASEPSLADSETAEPPAEVRPSSVKTPKEARQALETRGISASSESLERALAEDDAQLTRWILLARPDLAPNRRAGRRLLRRALDAGRLGFAASLLDAGVEADDDDLADAAKRGDLRVVQLLASRRQGDLEEALEDALDSRQWQTARVLVQNGVDLRDFEDETEDTLLELAERGDAAGVRWILENDPGLSSGVWRKAQEKAQQGGHSDLAQAIRRAKS